MVVIYYGGFLIICLMHGYVPKALCMGVICPIQKKVKGCTNFSDYGLITLITIFAKLFEMCLRERFKENFDLHELKVGFVKNGWCEKAIFVVRSVCEYFLNHGRSIYLASLDISKAYH